MVTYTLPLCQGASGPVNLATLSRAAISGTAPSWSKDSRQYQLRRDGWLRRPQAFQGRRQIDRFRRVLQRTGVRATWWNVGENSHNPAVGIEPHEVEWESHLRHPDRMPARCIPLQQKSIDPASGVLVQGKAG